jgi:hypothetical protein
MRLAAVIVTVPQVVPELVELVDDVELVELVELVDDVELVELVELIDVAVLVEDPEGVPVVLAPTEVPVAVLPPLPGPLRSGSSPTAQLRVVTRPAIVARAATACL